jgi:peroxiredoxin
MNFKIYVKGLSRVLQAVIIFMLFSSPAFSMGRTSTSQAPVFNGQKPFDTTLSKNTGESSMVVDSRQGKRALLVFWATWCPHCFQELEKLNSMVPDIEKKGIKVILVDMGETKEQVNAYMKHYRFNMESFIDEEQLFQEPYNVVGVPTIVFIDENGAIRAVTHEIPLDYEQLFNS